MVGRGLLETGGQGIPRGRAPARAIGYGSWFEWVVAQVAGERMGLEEVDLHLVPSGALQTTERQRSALRDPSHDALHRTKRATEGGRARDPDRSAARSIQPVAQP